MNIRCISPSDAESFSSLRREVTREFPVQMGISYEEECTRTVENFRAQLLFTFPNAMFGCFIDNELVATAAVGYTSKFPSSRHKMLMWGVFTSPRFQRQGYGRGVVTAAISNAFNNGVKRINLQVYTPNEPALTLYRSIGFTEYGVEPQAIQINGKFHDGVHMTLSVDHI